MSDFLSYIHKLRGVAILFVVGVHARGGVSDWHTETEVHHLLTVLFDSIEGNGTFMFVFIGGFLFQHLTRRGFDYPSYLDKKFLMIVIPYLVFSIPIIILRIKSNYYTAALPDDFAAYSVPVKFFYYLVIGAHIAPFWFITAIILFYLYSPVLHSLDKDWFYKWIFPFVLLAGMFTYRSESNGNPLLSFLHFLPVYLAGMCASRYKEKYLPKLQFGYFWILVVAYLAISYLSIAGYLPGKITFEEFIYEGKFVFNYYFLRALILCLTGLLLFYRWRNTRMRFFDLLGNYSFGIFFVHFLLIIGTRKVFSVLGIVLDFNLITFMAYYVFVVLASVSIVYLIKRVTGVYSRNLIGS